MTKFKFEPTHLFSYRATLSKEVIGPVPDDIRVNFHVTGGEIWQPDGKEIGKLRPVGGDWLTIRSDDQGVLDVRATCEMLDGSLLYVLYNGIVDLGEGGYKSVQRGQFPDKGTIRTAPRVQTSSPGFAWLNKTQLFGVGEVQFNKGIVEYDIYALR